ncbi:hypothetical protein CUC53_06965 [Aeromonas cavernicola]|uniref:DUF1107 domain-containing protein n=2 Tax=Aeromonas cavernicola TaxID=1006623 RepID=A0A2H9U667_9GAMM|nr:hypothetical protein CUC53_06965 [Aeromonas cavernicola]
MKVFKHGSPRQIARYIKRFHQGSFRVEALGQFEFHGGRIDLNHRTCRQTLTLIRQIKQELHDLRPLPLSSGQP